MKRLIVIMALMPMSLFAQKKVEKVENKVDSLAIPVLSIRDIDKFNIELQGIPYKDYQKLTPEMVLTYLVRWIKK